MAVLNPQGGILEQPENTFLGTPDPGLLAFLATVSAALLDSDAIQRDAQQPSAAGAQVAGAFVDLSAIPKFNVTDTGLADTEFAVVHNLGAIPTFVIPLPHEGQTVAGAPYASGTAWTSTTVYLKFPSANANIWIGLAV